MRGLGFSLLFLLLAGGFVAADTNFRWKLPGLTSESFGRWQLQQLVSGKGEAEAYAEVRNPDDLGVTVDLREEKLSENAYVVRVKLRNDRSRVLFLKSAFAATPALDDFQWWNGYANRIQTKFDPQDVSLSQWFPANAALGKTHGFSLGLDPLEVFSRVDSGLGDDGRQLILDIPIVLNPGEERTTSFVVTSFPARYGYRDAVQNYYALFPKAYRPVNVDPEVISSQTTYLFWKPSECGLEYPDDMIRRYTGGYGGWEWCYSPFIRGGDWAITYEWSEGFRNVSRNRIDKQRKSIQERMARADALGVAPMYYVNVLWAEKTLMEEHFPEALNNPITRRSWGAPAVVGLYPWANRYGELFVESIRNIAAWYPQSRGIGWDSAFGHARAGEEVAGVLQTEFRSFEKGEQFVLVGVGYTPLLDLNRSLKSGDYDRANAVNLKLVSPYFLGVRSDAALYEGHPAQNPNRIMRFEVMRANLGSPKALSWHKDLVPSHLNWIDWDALDAVQVRDGMRQLYQDVLMLSYFWGGIPSARMPTLGVPFVVREIPTLIELVRKGWQPSPAVEAVSGGETLLFARYGRGAGAVVAVINPEFTSSTVTLNFPIDYWEGKNLVLARRDNQPIRVELTENRTLADIEISPRSVLLLDVVALVEAESYGRDREAITATPVVYNDGRKGWNFRLETFIISKWVFSVAPAAEGFISTSIRIGRKENLIPAGEPVSFVLDSSGWPDDVQEMNRRRGNFAITYNPLVAFDVNVEQLKALNWFTSKGGGTSIVFDGVDQQMQDKINPMLERWFLFYTSNVLGTTERPQPAPDGKGVVLTFKLGDALSQTKPCQAKASIDIKDGGNIVVTAANDADLMAAANRLLRLMDEAFPCYGLLNSKDETLEFAGLYGAVLEEEMESDFILKPTLSERWKEYFDRF